ncbi:Arylsulfatase A [Draconibacterium orientale]|uniref:Arylsulfatase A n=1 Tax=Draconibacterium orientale TaxID=1168034 RepID=X5DES1_9BACT|nr:sulfatase-like hydrolase/transferase [Draconibacterium orientale]AHW58847.1 N-acetylgalactosamine 6-sulfatase [Draconibacterium orientale]SET93658.1 Arylsulfatase A [Draconibacterium orientale]
MMMRNTIVIMMVLSIVALTRVHAQEKPNIILILTDDMGYSDIGCFGGNFVPTPNIDRIAERGVKFTQYYSAAPICSPSRTGILTGMYPAEWNFTTFLNDRRSNARAEQANYLNVNAPSMAKVMKSAGYATGHFGKWHMGGGRDIKNAPNFDKYGFDEHISTYESPDPDSIITSTDWIWSNEDSIKRWDRTKYFVNKTLDFLKRHQGEPCFVNLWPDDMHTPWVPEVDFRYTGQYPMNPEEEKSFKMVLQEYDNQMGRLLDGIKKLGIENNTIIIFTSDNGPLPSFKGSRAGGLRGTKLSLYEGGIRMPFIVKWPGHVPEGVTDSTSVLNGTDLLPTLASIASASLPADYKGDGENRESVLLGKYSPREKDMYWEYGRNSYAFNYPKGRDHSPNLAIRSGDWKLLMNYQSNNVELYDMKNDVYETSNVAEEHPDLVNDLKQKLITWRMYLPVLTPDRANPARE